MQDTRKAHIGKEKGEKKTCLVFYCFEALYLISFHFFFHHYLCLFQKVGILITSLENELAHISMQIFESALCTLPILLHFEESVRNLSSHLPTAPCTHGLLLLAKLRDNCQPEEGKRRRLKTFE